jgi:ribosomal protein L7Ae-like RNA K-turn-binding protein
MIQVSKEEYDVIKKILIDGTNEVYVTITDGEREIVIIMEDAYEKN